MSTLNLSWGGASDVGRVRQGNEDALLAEHGVFVVADGMGGHNAGEVASELAVTTMRAALRDSVLSTEQLRELVQQANTSIYTASLDDSTQQGMGTTLTALVMIPGVTDRVLVANVGDSRTYVLRNGQLSRITTDHSYVQELVNEGVITADDARKHPQKNIVTRALGIDRYVAVDVFSHDMQPGDRFLLCSDGLVDEVTDAEITQILLDNPQSSDAATELVVAANAAGGRDNTTVIVVDVITADTDGATPSAPIDSSPLLITTATSSSLGNDAASEARKKRSRRTLITSLVVSLVLLVFLAVSTLVGVYARSGYFIGTNDDNIITIYRGRAGGVWWFNPTIELESELKLTDVPTGVVREVRNNTTFDSLAEAQQYIEFVNATVTTTTTTVPTTDTTTPATSTTTGG
jgi:serine/threonine protein phosphatase PrpC